MAIWYEVDKSDDGIKNFLECNWFFHDFIIDKIEYHRQEKIVEMFMMYDELKGSIVLRFINTKEINIKIPEDDYDIWVFGSSLIISEDNNFIWIADDSYTEIDKMKEYATWVKSERILWAVTDENGKPCEMPLDKIEQTWYVYEKEECHHFILKEFTGEKDLIKEFY